MEYEGKVGKPLVAMVGRLSLVADNVHPTDHLADREETDHLSKGDTRESDVLGAGVADAGHDGLGRSDGLEGSGVARGIDEGLEVGLEGGHAPERC